jgi:tRNA A58 N-methylase Trm61
MESGDLDAGRAEQMVKKRERQVRRDTEHMQRTALIETGTNVDIRHGDFRVTLTDLTDVDAIITDPPYPKQYLPLLDDLAVWADQF